MAGLLVAMALLILPASAAGLLVRKPQWGAFADGAVVGVVALLVGGSIVPDAVGTAGGWAVVSFGLGLALPSLAERLGARHSRVDGFSRVVAQGLLVLHAIFDGVALAAPGPGFSALALSIALHQIPVGLAVFAFQQNRLGNRGATLVLVLLAAATGLGFATGDTLVSSFDRYSLALFQGFAAGFVLHVIGHGGLPGAEGRHRLRGLGAAATLLLLMIARGAGLVRGEGGTTSPAGLSVLLVAVSSVALEVLRRSSGHKTPPSGDTGPNHPSH